MLKPLDIAGMVCPNNVVLAPMAGYTNLPFRTLCEDMGAGLTFTEMVSAKGLHYANEETKTLLLHTPCLPPSGGRCPERADEGRTFSTQGAQYSTPSPLSLPLQGGGQECGELSLPLQGGGQDEVKCGAKGQERGGAQGQERGESLPLLGDPDTPCLPPSGGRCPEGADEGRTFTPVHSPRPLAVQLFGSDPSILREACESEELRDFDLVDINMGCPMPKIVKNGEGSALLENLPLAETIISECVKSGKRISVKFRIGIREGENHAVEYAKVFEGAGACLLTVHGRVRERIYTGPPDYDAIAAVKKAVKIPVLANGGVWSRKDAQKMLERTGADGVMIARAALYNPRVFCDILENERPPLLPLFLRQLEETRELYGERFALVFLRKMAAFYLKGTRGAVKGKLRLFSTETTDSLAALAQELMQDL